MKIVYLVHQFYPEFQAGTEKFVFNTAYMSQQNGNMVKVITYSLADPNSFPYRFGDILYREFHYQGIPVIAWRYKKEPGDLHYRINSDVDINFALRILQQEKPDIIHVGHLMRIYPFIFAIYQLDIPYVLTITDFHLLCPKLILSPATNMLCSGPGRGKNCSNLCSELPKTFIENRLEISTKILRNASKVVAPSRFVAEIFEQEVEGLKVLVNHHGVAQSNIKVKNRIYHSDDKITFGFIGNLAFHKGVHVLIHAFSGMSSTNSRLILFGSGQDYYINQIQAIAGTADVKFMGTFHSEELGDVFDQIDVLVVPSICYETYSFVVHEALACEVPVIVSNLGGMPEKIEDGVNGFTFLAGDAEELRSKMQMIADNPIMLNDIKQAIKMKTFVPNVEQEAYRYNQIYQQIAGGKRS